MENTQKIKMVTQMLGVLRKLYPSLKCSEKEWAEMVGAWGSRLLEYHPEAVRRAFDRCLESYPDWFPTYPQFQTLVRQEALELKRAKERAAQMERPALPPPPEPELSDENPFKELARRWEDESRRLGLDPERPTPREIGERRMKEFWGAWNRRFEKKKMA